MLASCTGAVDPSAGATASPSARATAAETSTPSTSWAQVTVEPSDVGIETVQAIHAALARGDADTAWQTLGPQTRAAVGGPDDLRALEDLLEPLVGESAPFDDVIVAQTPDEIIHLVVLGDGDTPEPVSAEVVRRDGRATAELSPPVPSQVEITVQRRQRITIATPAARDVELLVDGFHFHPSIGAGGDPSVMNIPYPLSTRQHVLGAWYRTDAGDTGIGVTTVDVRDD